MDSQLSLGATMAVTASPMLQADTDSMYSALVSVGESENVREKREIGRPDLPMEGTGMVNLGTGIAPISGTGGGMAKEAEPVRAGASRVEDSCGVLGALVESFCPTGGLTMSSGCRALDGRWNSMGDRGGVANAGGPLQLLLTSL